MGIVFPRVVRSVSAGQAYLLDLQQRVLDHRVLRHPLVRAFEGEVLTFPQVREFGLLYYPHILRTRLYQAAALSRCLDEPLQFALASILADEYGSPDGQLDPDRTHPAIYRKFLRALGHDEAGWADPPIIDELAAYIETHYTLCSGPELTAVGCAGLAMEWPIPPLYRRILTGLRRFEELDEDALELFVGHVDQDVVHGRLIRDALLPHVERTASRALVERGVFASLDARDAFMSGLARAIGLRL